MRGATTKALRGIRGDLEFHTFYRMSDENKNQYTGSVPDGISVPEKHSILKVTLKDKQ